MVKTEERPVFVNSMPRYEILSEDAMAVLDRGWRRLVSEIGIEFLLPEAVELLRGAGQVVEDENRVRFDPEFILEQVAKAPRQFDLQARNPEHTVTIGGENMVFAPVYGCPFIREGDVRRDAKMADFENLVRLSQAFPELDSPGGTICEPEDRPLDSRHLDMVFALQTLTDKPYMGSVTSGPNAADTIRMGEILFGGREAIERAPVSISLINVNSPLRYDDRMLAAMFEYVKAGQAVVITPFLLMGAMSPVSLPATLVQQMAEALAGIALSQLIRPGAPVVFGSFLSNTDMQSGSPSFGTPESGIGVLCTGQIARHFGLPWRGGGALNASQTVDAQAAYESLMTFLPTFLAGANFVMHSAGWLEGGLVSCYEKFIVDVELLRELKHEFTPLQIDEDALAFSAHQEVGPGGHFLGAVHTLERFRECFYRPLLSSTENFDRWKRNGARDATVRAGEIWRKTLEEYEQPPLDDALREELAEFVSRRRTELGD
ncbi:MAG TPA: trimethylamine methyltransferase family protein [Solirubrobacteraceae bacterium]|nr:trimethylamine methyltransferase family protein [Solirubrobacteraceae bacterium]